MWWVYHSSWWYEYTCTVSFVLFNIYLHIMVSPNMHKKVNKQSNRYISITIYIYKMNDTSISDLSLYVSDCISTVVYFCDWLMLIIPQCFLAVIYVSDCISTVVYFSDWLMLIRPVFSSSDLSLYVSDCISTVVYFCNWLMLIRPVFSSSDLCVWLYKYCSLLQWLIDVN